MSVSIPVKFDMNKSNYTGASIGGFELGSGNCLIAYAKDVSSSCKTRNVYISVTDELFNGTQNIALTNYGTSSKVTCRTPQLIKINDNLFLVMWEEYNSSTGKTATKTMTVDSNGKTVTKAISHSFGLSDCQPVVCSDGMVNGMSQIIQHRPFTSSHHLRLTIIMNTAIQKQFSAMPPAPPQAQ